MSVLLALLVVSVLFLVPMALARWGQRGKEIHGWLGPLWGVNRLYCSFFHRLRLHNEAALPETGPAMLISNHTCGADNFLLQAGCHRVLGFLVAQEWYDHKVCGIFCRLLECIPVRRDGRDLAATREAVRALERGRVVPLFPEGKILPMSGKEFGPGLPGAAYLALRSKAPVYPAYIRGTPPAKEVMKGFLGFSNAEVIFGQPIDLSRFYDVEGDRAAVLAEVTECMMDSIKQLKAKLEAGD